MAICLESWIIDARYTHMALFDTSDGLILTQEGTDVRARCGQRNYLFRDRIKEAVLREYTDSVKRVRSWFGPRRDRLGGDKISDEEYESLTQEIALHWMYFYIVNRMKVNVTDADLDHPQSKAIIWTFLCGKYGSESPLVPQVASQMMGITPSEFGNWLVGWKRFLDR